METIIGYVWIAGASLIVGMPVVANFIGTTVDIRRQLQQGRSKKEIKNDYEREDALYPEENDWLCYGGQRLARKVYGA